MYLCLDCGQIFEHSKHYVEAHGFDSPPYEEWNGCPACGGSFIDALQCSICGKYIRDDFIELKNGDIIGECCYELKSIQFLY